jgi:hypothetical protein
MAIRSDSFSSVDEVKSFTRHLLDGHATFDTTTHPTLTEVEKFIDRASALLNTALSNNGFTPSAVYGNAVAKLACDDWVTMKAVKYTELTQRGTGWNADEGSRTAAFSLPENADEFVEMMFAGFVNMGIDPAHPMSDGLAFTGLTVQSARTDPSDSSKEQPLFSRRNFDNS